MKYEIILKDNKRAIFEKDTGKQISEWFNHIFSYGLVSGQSDFYIAGNNNGKLAIFHKNGTRISEWFDNIFSKGLIEGTSNSYKADGKMYKYDPIKELIKKVNENDYNS